VLGAALALTLCGAVAAEPVSVAGEHLYHQGQLASGQPLLGQRTGQPPLQGRDAACAQCHGRSGLGTVEGRIVVPPITGRFLFHPGERIAPQNPGHADATHLPPTPRDRAAYDEETLARVIREGIGADGRPLDYLMPRFDLDDASMRELTAYLRHLSSGRVPGVTDITIHFATIITPDADPVARDGMLKVIEQYFSDKNGFYQGGSDVPLPAGARGIRLRTRRQWQLHVWRLAGAPQTWQAQLDQHLRAEPVFAVISGLGGATWEPVHRFCERQAIPCLLPNADLPVVAPGDFYSVYFSQGVLLEAQLVAQRIGQPDAGQAASSRIVQVFREDDIGAAAAARLRQALPNGAVLVDRALGHADGPHELARALAQATRGDVVVLWLRGADLAALPTPTAAIPAVYVSGLMGGLEHAPLAPAWRSLARITYPYELPETRSLRMNYPLGWFHLHQIPVVAERVQVDTYVACSVLVDALASMLDEFVRDYLVERVEGMLDSRIINGYYTRLGLAPGQRFASKGGYLVRFVEPTGVKVAADGGWIVPWSSEIGDIRTGDRGTETSGH
jgi:hypothetical protein